MTKAEDEKKAAEAKAAEEAKQAKASQGDKQAEGRNMSSDPNKDPSKPIEADHGEEPEYLKRQREEQEKAAKDPMGDTPVQMRPDAHVNEVDEDAPKVAIDPLNPEMSPNAPQGGTLPPAG